jgi:hypothetical protein
MEILFNICFCNEADMAYCTVLVWDLPEGTEKNTKSSLDSRSPGRHLNAESSDYEAGLLTTRPRPSVFWQCGHRIFKISGVSLVCFTNSPGRQSQVSKRSRVQRAGSKNARIELAGILVCSIATVSSINLLSQNKTDYKQLNGLKLYYQPESVGGKRYVGIHT